MCLSDQVCVARWIMDGMGVECLGSRSGGAALLERAAVGRHAAAPPPSQTTTCTAARGHAGAALHTWGRAGSRPHVVRRDLVEGHRLMVTVLEALALAAAMVGVGVEGLLLLPDFGWSVPEATSSFQGQDPEAD